MILIRFLLLGLTLTAAALMAAQLRGGQNVARQSPPMLLLPAHREEGSAL